MPRRLLPMLPLLLLACQEDPMRNLSLAQGQAGGGAGRTNVADMLARARANDQAPPSRMVLRYAGTEVQPDAAQRAELLQFAAANRGAPHVVVIARASAPATDGSLLNQRRALAVARQLEGQFREVQLRFERDAPVGQVLVLRDAGTGLAVPGAAPPSPR